jgi:hypothetical protein
VLLHELCDDPIETFLAKHGVAEPSSATATKQFHQVKRTAPSLSSKNYVWSTSATAYVHHAWLSTADVPNDLPEKLRDRVRLWLKCLRCVGITWSQI